LKTDVSKIVYGPRNGQAVRAIQTAPDGESVFGESERGRVCCVASKNGCFYHQVAGIGKLSLAPGKFLSEPLESVLGNPPGFQVFTL
jgi:hypothetical protein